MWICRSTTVQPICGVSHHLVSFPSFLYLANTIRLQLHLGRRRGVPKVLRRRHHRRPLPHISGGSIEPSQGRLEQHRLRHDHLHVPGGRQCRRRSPRRQQDLLRCLRRRPSFHLRHHHPVRGADQRPATAMDLSPSEPLSPGVASVQETSCGSCKSCLAACPFKAGAKNTTPDCFAYAADVHAIEDCLNDIDESCRSGCTQCTK